MRQRALIDTDVVSFLFKRDSRTLGYLEIMDSFAVWAISFQTRAELEFWAINKQWSMKRRDELRYFLSPFEVIRSDDTCIAHWAQLRSDRMRAGRPMHPEDAWAAATALAAGTPLITNNYRDFRDIGGLEVLSQSL